MILDYRVGCSVRVRTRDENQTRRRQNQRQGRRRRTVPNTADFEDGKRESHPREFISPLEARKGNRSSPRVSRRNAAPPTP